MKKLSSCSSASKRKPKRCADLLHPLMIQADHPLPQTFLRDGHRVVQIYRASALHPVIHIQDHLRRHISDCRSNGGHGYGRQMGNGAVAREYENWPLLVRLRKLAEMNITPIQSSGQAAVSQGRYSSRRCG